jgi:hypothetical protein
VKNYAAALNPVLRALAAQLANSRFGLHADFCSVRAVFQKRPLLKGKSCHWSEGAWRNGSRTYLCIAIASLPNPKYQA